MLTQILFVGFGGFIGSIARFGFIKLFNSFSFPIATLISNILAGLAIGLIIGYSLRSPTNAFMNNENVKLFLTTGLLGGLSTFSTFSLETLNYITYGKYLLAVINIGLNLIISISMVLVGFKLVEAFLLK